MNLVINIDSTGAVSADVIKYNLTSPFVLIPGHDTYADEVQKEFYNLFTERETTGYHCITYISPICTTLGGGYTSSHICNSNACVVAYYDILEICFPTGVYGEWNTGGDGGGGDNGPAPGEVSGQNTGGVGYYTGNGVGVVPVLPVRTKKEIEEQFYANNIAGDEEMAVWWNNPDNVNLVRSLVDYLFDNNEMSLDGENPSNFMVWAVRFFYDNPGTTWSEFENWFMVPNEGAEVISYDAEFWDNPDLAFPQQDLPTWSAFDAAYPRIYGSQLIQDIGGDVLTAFNQYPSLIRGACALKVSKALNYSGITIPQITTTNGNLGTVLGGDGKFYFLNAKALNKWMRETFGTNPASSTTPFNSSHINITGAQGGTNGENFPTLVANIQGIYSMVSTNPNWASGHCDLINNGTCVFGCHFYDTPPAPIDYIDIWILQ